MQYVHLTGWYVQCLTADEAVVCSEMCSSRTHVTQEPWRTPLYNWTMRRGMRTNIPLDFAHMVAHDKFKDHEAKARETPKLLLAGAGMLCSPCPNSYTYLCPPFALALLSSGIVYKEISQRGGGGGSARVW